MKKPIGIFGGTFDPIHLGHLSVAKEAYKQCKLQQVKFIPCYQSPFKELPIAAGADRLTMIELAIASIPEFYADDREIKNKKVSYTVDTLNFLRQEAGDTPLCLIMSMDAFAKFNLWHKWQEIMKLTHLVVANRPDSQPIIDNVADLLKQNQVFDADKLQSKTHGYIFFINIPPNYISATKIRALIKAGVDVSDTLPKKVRQFITERKLYRNA